MPVYNAQLYIDPCIKSVLTQSFRDLELILIDDGSTDDSLKRCLMWKSDRRVRVISTENRGVSAARNLGLRKASGEWIMFLDSDDYLLPGCLAHMMDMVEADTQEVLAAYGDDEPCHARASKRSVSANAVSKMTLDAINDQLLPAFYEVKPLSLSSCWAKLYRTDVIRKNTLSFREDLRLSEDTLFNLDYLACIEHVMVTNLKVVCYRQNPASVTRGFNGKHLANRFRFFDILKERYAQDAAVHILSLLFWEICKIERQAKGSDRSLLEKEIVRFLSENADILHSVGNRSLSAGKWQRLVFQAAAACFRRRAYRAGFALFRVYAAAAPCI